MLLPGPTTIINRYECNPVHLATVSPDSAYLATAIKTGCSGSRIVVRKMSSHDSEDNVVASIALPGLASSGRGFSVLIWSPDSRLLMASHNEHGSIVIMSPIDNPDWKCTIEQGFRGLAACMWAPDSRHVLALGDFSLGLDIWSLNTQSNTMRVDHAKSPFGHSAPIAAAPSMSTVAFNNSFRYLSVIRRRDCKDSISIHDPREGFKRVYQFELATNDACNVVWPPFKDSQLLVCESPVAYPATVALFYVYSVTGEQLMVLKAPSDGLSRLAISPLGNLVAAGTVGGQTFIFNTDTYALVASFSHGDKSLTSNADERGKLLIYKMEDQHEKGPRYELQDGLDESLMKDLIPTTGLGCQKAPLIGSSEFGNARIDKLEWSPSGRYLATLDERQPTTIYVWCCSTLRPLAVFLHPYKVEDFKWDPHTIANSENRARLIVTMGQQQVHSCIISPNGPFPEAARSFKLPRQSSANAISWSAAGEILIVNDNKHGKISVLTRAHLTGPHGG